MLQFMYTDALPGDEELGDSPSEMLLQLLAAADRCSELKNKCIDFFVMEGNFKKAMLTKGFVQLGQKFPSIIDELRERVGL
nr:unnamed protein product [Digitaria exilis]